MQHLKIAEVEDAEIVTDSIAMDIGDSFEIKGQDMLPPLPVRDPINDTPRSKAFKDNRELKEKYVDVKKKKSANIRKKLRNRANKVKLKPLPPGKPTPEARRKWLDELHKRETKLLQKK